MKLTVKYQRFERYILWLNEKNFQTNEYFAHYFVKEETIFLSSYQCDNLNKMNKKHIPLIYYELLFYLKFYCESFNNDGYFQE